MAGSPFRIALGEAVDRLPEAVRAVHDGARVVDLEGVVDVDGAETALGRLVAAVIGFPRGGRGLPAHVRIARGPDGSEIWTRTFGGARFETKVTARGSGTLVERFGPIAFNLAIGLTKNGFALTVEGWRILGVPAPRALAPRTRAVGFAREDGAYGFDIEIEAPLLKRLVRYRGAARPRAETAPLLSRT